MADREEIRGDRVILRPMVRTDVDEMASWPRFAELSLQWANLELEMPFARDSYYDRSRSNATRCRFVIRDTQGRLVGTIGLRDMSTRMGEGTLGIIIRADEVNHGYGSDAVRTLMAYAFETLGLRRVYLDVAADNLRARHVYEKLGFAVTGQHIGALAMTYVDMMLSQSSFAAALGTGTVPSLAERPVEVRELMFYTGLVSNEE